MIGRTYPPRPTAAVIAGIRALSKPGVSAARAANLADGGRSSTLGFPNAAPDVLPSDMKAAHAAILFAGKWEAWAAGDTKRKIKATRAKLAALRAVRR